MTNFNSELSTLYVGRHGLYYILKSYIRIFILFFGFIFLSLGSIFAQRSKLIGKVSGFGSNNPILNAQVKLTKNSNKIGITNTNESGDFLFSDLEPGNYDIMIYNWEYDTLKYQGIKIEGDKTVGPVNFHLVPVGGVENNITDITIHGGDHRTIGIGRCLECGDPPITSIPNVIKEAPGATEDAAGRISIRGDRPGGTQFIVNGQRVGSNSPLIPRLSIASIDMITGGTPAEYGDLTGAVVNITTYGPSAHFAGGLEGLTSQFIDPFGYNQIEGYLRGPLIKDKKDGEKSILGFTVSGDYTHAGVNTPPAIDMYTVKDDVLRWIKNNPVRSSSTGEGFVSNASFVTKDQMQKTRLEQNTASNSYSFAGTLEYQPAYNISLSAGGSVDHTAKNAFIYSYSMFNADNNPMVTDNNYRGNIRFKQSFQTAEKSMIRDIYYVVELSYSSHNQTIEDQRLGTNYFGYGYLGTFNRKYTPQYKYEKDTIGGKAILSHYLQGYTETNISFIPGGLNKDAENYTKSFFDLNGGSVSSFTDIQSKGGLINGQSPGLIYSLWAAPGTNYTSYSKQQQEQYNLDASGTATLNGKHTVKFGLQYQQNVNRSYTVGGNFGTNIEGLWTLARQELNNHLTQLDKSNPILVYSNGSFTDTVNYGWQENKNIQSQFDKNFRAHLISEGARDNNGRLINQQTIINLDQYKPSDLSLSYFSPDELLNNGHSYINAYGYDYQGNKLTGKQSISDFLDPLKRTENAYNPIYAAGYIQDKFEWNNVKMNIGLRVDRFDANQKVLADPYSFFPIKTAGEVSSLNGVPVNRPGNIGAGYYVYVDDLQNPKAITGYRNGNTWYDANGAEQTDPKQIAQLSTSGTITPYLENKNQKVISEASFKNYTPQVNLMPRISFSFPISDMSDFYANYTVLTIRPENNFGALDYYYYLNNRTTNIVPNPDLKPTQRTNYEIGFNQKISSDAWISIDAYYGQIKDLVQIVKYNYAYPVTYTSYGNVDFGTVKGVSVGFNTRHGYEHPHSGLLISANYTLQFADGTGSGSSSAGDLVSAGFPNLRTTFPLDYDTRHQINCNLDYQFGNALDYQGPIDANGNKIFKDASINLVLNLKSGNPYTAQSNVTPDVEIGVANRSAITGSINGERMPWQFRADLRIDKNFRVLNAKGEKKKGLYFNAYLQVQNLLDARDIVKIYKFTGLPNQDGYLQSASGQNEASNAASQQAFIDQYSVKLNDPSNYVAPRIVRLGLSVNF